MLDDRKGISAGVQLEVGGGGPGECEGARRCGSARMHAPGRGRGRWGRWHSAQGLSAFTYAD